VIVTAVVSAALSMAATSASAAIRCGYDPATRVLSVYATEGAAYLGSEAELERVGDRIEVSDSFSGHRVKCHGSPTVTNTDRIKLRSLGFLSSVEISLAGGPFAPGATPEADGSSEIEFTLAGRGGATVTGGPEADHFSYVTEGGRSGINLDPGPEGNDTDIDLVTADPRTLLIVDGGPGPDTIDVLDRPRVEVQARGGPGDDSLSAVGDASLGAILEGEEGADQIVGSAGEDIIRPGPGPDLVRAEGGADEIWNPPDRSRDSIECGGGDDLVFEREPRDRLRSCESVRPDPTR
jgi:hypothetical protein